MPRLTAATCAVMDLFVEEPDRPFFGAEILAGTKLESGTVYPLLARLQKEGWLSGRWEDPNLASLEGRPRRHYYELTAQGNFAYAAAVARREGRVGARLRQLKPFPGGA